MLCLYQTKYKFLCGTLHFVISWTRNLLKFKIITKWHQRETCGVYLLLCQATRRWSHIPIKKNQPQPGWVGGGLQASARFPVDSHFISMMMTTSSLLWKRVATDLWHPLTNQALIYWRTDRRICTWRNSITSAPAGVALRFIPATVNVYLCAQIPHNKDCFHHFWTVITVPLRKLSRWVWNMQQFVWSLRCLFRTAFACNYNKLGSMPCHWCIPFVLWNNFLFLREKSRRVFFNVQPTSVTTHQLSTEIILNLEEQL